MSRCHLHHRFPIIFRSIPCAVIAVGNRTSRQGIAPFFSRASSICQTGICRFGYLGGVGKYSRCHDIYDNCEVIRVLFLSFHRGAEDCFHLQIVYSCERIPLSFFWYFSIISGVAQHGLLFIAVSVIYNFLVILGGSFYTFQWDTLLVEAGFLTALCLAPWQTLKLKSRLQNSDNCDDSIVGSWPLRFLLFKLMFMSGVVKIQADCPTWQNLTALEYHFATQCLPGPLSWHAHQLHPLFLRLGVAATFVIEIPATFLLLFPSSRVRKVGAWMQIFLQVLIIATGNYNFFNLLTVALCLPCMIGSGSSEKKMIGTICK